MIKNEANCSSCTWGITHVCGDRDECYTCPNENDNGTCRCTNIRNGEECPYYDQYSEPHVSCKYCKYCENGGRNPWFSNMGIESTIRIMPPSPWENRYRLEVCGERIPIDFCPKCGRKLQGD